MGGQIFGAKLMPPRKQRNSYGAKAELKAVEVAKSILALEARQYPPNECLCALGGDGRLEWLLLP